MATTKRPYITKQARKAIYRDAINANALVILENVLMVIKVSDGGRYRPTIRKTSGWPI
ncbi:hypothetical protein [Photorhabdus sp. CRCIA-P01]|uniref:hypothetical protein n=1 Tax=Photorhabdus sp. CRCIA-P01 TaxID=2019570 RepID=UPI0013004E03|nr:hypothetical protein [Photorhabdus sp. CRCIA-P01]